MALFNLSFCSSCGLEVKSKPCLHSGLRSIFGEGVEGKNISQVVFSSVMRRHIMFDCCTSSDAKILRLRW